MPSRSSSGNVRTHEALPAPKWQQKFPARRTSVKARTATPKLSKDQSTLTQIDFFPSSNIRDEIVDSDSDFENPRPKKRWRKSTPVVKEEEHSSDGKFEEPLPKKKRRKSKAVAKTDGPSSDDELEAPLPKKKRKKSKFDEKEAGQSTLTQFDRTFSAKKMHHEFELDEEGFQIWEDSDAELRSHLDHVENGGPEIPETSQLDRQDGAVFNDAGDENEAATAQPDKFRTPRKVQFKEVPSSQTPPSTAESVKTAIKKSVAARSPLQERSYNTQPAPLPPQQSRESQNISMKMLERVHFQTKRIPLNDMARNVQSTAPTPSAPANPSVLPTAQPMARPRVLTRTSTIQDSQSEGASLSIVSSKESLAEENTASLGPSPQDVVSLDVSPQRAPPQQNIPPVRRLKRVTTVQDSQFDYEDLLSDPHGLDQANESAVEDLAEKQNVDDQEDHELELIEASQYPHEDSQYDHFDPANSALDRDALRFRWTQTQKPLSNIDEESDAETDDGDLDRGRSDDTTVRFNVPMAEPSFEYGTRIKSPESKEANETTPILETAERTPKLLSKQPDSRDDSAYESSDHANQTEVLVPSSPPSRSMYWPSQLSTVMPTQASIQEVEIPIKQEQHSNQLPSSDPIDPPQKHAFAERATVPISPYKPMQHFDMLSSSPFPLPPWSSPQTKGPRREGEGDESSSPFRASQLPKLVDFSLPPPPSLGSSRRGTPASSSRW